MTESIETSESDALPWEPNGYFAPKPMAAPGGACLLIDFRQATDLLAMFGGEPNEITLQFGEGHSGRGVYASYTDMPEEGAIFLGVSDQEAMPEKVGAVAVNEDHVAHEQPSDEEILVLNAGERLFSETPSKYGLGTQYHTGEPGLLTFAREAMALATAAQPVPRLTEAEFVEWFKVNYYGEVVFGADPTAHAQSIYRRCGQP